MKGRCCVASSMPLGQQSHVLGSARCPSLPEAFGSQPNEGPRFSGVRALEHAQVLGSKITDEGTSRELVVWAGG